MAFIVSWKFDISLLQNWASQTQTQHTSENKTEKKNPEKSIIVLLLSIFIVRCVATRFALFNTSVYGADAAVKCSSFNRVHFWFLFSMK